MTISDVQPVRFNDAFLLFSGVILANRYDVHVSQRFPIFPKALIRSVMSIQS